LVISSSPLPADPFAVQVSLPALLYAPFPSLWKPRRTVFRVLVGKEFLLAACFFLARYKKREPAQDSLL